MSGQFKTVQDLTEYAVQVLEMPEFQRDSVEWDATKAAALLDSLYHGMDVGQVSVWKTTGQVFVRRPGPVPVRCGEGTHLVMDGGHRTTVLTYLCQTVMPRWSDLSDPDVQRVVRDIRGRTAYDLIENRFEAVSHRLVAEPGNRWMPVTELFGDLGVTDVADPVARDDERQRVLAERVAQAHLSEGREVEPHRLNTAWATRQRVLGRQLHVSVAELSLRKALENFQRLNSAGVVLDQDQLLLGLLAIAFEGFRGGKLKPAVAGYTARGLGGTGKSASKKVQAALARTFVTELLHQQDRKLVARMGDVELEDMLDGEVDRAWSRTVQAWDTALAYLSSHGIAPDQLTALNALAPLVLFALRDPACAFGADDDRLLALYLYNIKSERYTKQSTDAYEMDAPTILNATDFASAYKAMIAEIDRSRAIKFNDDVRPFSHEELLRYRVNRLKCSDPMSLYYAAWASRRGATDWATGEPVRASRKARNGQLASQNHHVWPLHLARQHGIDPKDDANAWVDSVAAIAVLRDATNNALGDKVPQTALAELDVDTEVLDARLAAQLWGDVARLNKDTVRRIIENRARKLAPELSWFVHRVHEV